MTYETHIKTEVGSETNNTKSEAIPAQDIVIEENREYTGRGYNLRSRSVPVSGQRHDVQLLQQDVCIIKNEDMMKMLDEGALQRVVKHIVGVVMTQMTEKAGIKKHGENAVAVMYNEFFQLDDKTVFEGVMVTDLTQKQRKMALSAINLIKEKRCGKLKGITVADGSAQRRLYTKEETTSPTI